MTTRALSYQVVAALAKHTATVIFLHGLGDSSAGWLPVAKMLNNQLPHVKWVLPNAPERTVTANLGLSMPAWFDIYSFDWEKAAEDREGMLASASSIDQLIQAEIDAGIPSERIALGGFSQGGVMSLLTGLTNRGGGGGGGGRKLGGIVMLSGWLPLRNEFKNIASSHLKETPVLMCHGTADPLVPFNFGKMTRKIFTSDMNLPALADLTGEAGLCFRSYDMGHESCQQEIGDVAQFLQRVLPRD